uniref:Reverse transcriptase domain-containing protein n=1 Tax=Tanacetum cinerariifolium TaxID=118510 RepID=A0A699HCR0_TANCI|nr:reverse transcriptase domain-containing protein [Tanacetum cinerariifolium]
MPITRQGTSNNMTPEAVRAMIDQAKYKNSTNGDGNYSFGEGPTRPIESLRACSYSDFIKCQPLNFRGTKGVVGLSRWFKKMESVFHISGCDIENQFKGNDVVSYTQRFQELALICTKFVADEKEKVDKYIGGLPDNIHGNVMSTRPKTFDEAIELANDLMDQKLHTYAKRQTESKRKFNNKNQAQQIPRGRMWLKLTPLGLVKGRSMLELFHCATSVRFTSMARALQREETNQDLDDIEDDINA